MEFKELAKERYSCRKFSDREVENEKIEQIIQAGIDAPTAVNTQPFKIFVFDSKKSKKDLKNYTRFTFDADKFLLIGYKKEEGWTREFDKRNFADVDASIVATHMMLEITDLGLATTWVGHFNAPLLKENYPQMKDYELIALFPIGYPAEEASKKHFIRKAKEEVVEVL